jgi:hypothetical protein
MGFAGMTLKDRRRPEGRRAGFVVGVDPGLGRPSMGSAGMTPSRRHLTPCMSLLIRGARMKKIAPTITPAQISIVKVCEYWASAS